MLCSDGIPDMCLLCISNFARCLGPWEQRPQTLFQKMFFLNGVSSCIANCPAEIANLPHAQGFSAALPRRLLQRLVSDTQSQKLCGERW